MSTERVCEDLFTDSGLTDWIYLSPGESGKPIYYTGSFTISRYTLETMYKLIFIDHFMFA